MGNRKEAKEILFKQKHKMSFHKQEHKWENIKQPKVVRRYKLSTICAGDTQTCACPYGIYLSKGEGGAAVVGVQNMQLNTAQLSDQKWDSGASLPRVQCQSCHSSPM